MCCVCGEDGVYCNQCYVFYLCIYMYGQLIGLIQSNGGVVVASPVPDVIVVTGDRR